MTDSPRPNPVLDRKVFTFPGLLALLFVAGSGALLAWFHRPDPNLALRAAAAAAGAHFLLWWILHWAGFFLSFLLLAAAGARLAALRLGGDFQAAKLAALAAAGVLLFSWGLVLWRRDARWLLELQFFLYQSGQMNLREIRRTFPPWGAHRRARALLEPLRDLVRQGAEGLARAEYTLERFLGARAAGFARRQGVKQTWRGETARVLVLFADLRGFTGLAERLPPGETVTFLNRFFREAEAVVTAAGGEVNKYLGDAVLAFFPLPEGREREAAAKVVQSALDLQDRYREVRETFKETYSARVEEVGLGVGISAGLAVLGNVGSVNRMEFTLIGDTVNLASRLCSIAEDGQVLVNEELAALVAEDFRLETLGAVRLKGKRQPHVPSAVQGRRFTQGLA